MVKVGVTILNADYGNMQSEVDKVSNADFLHLDVTDGHFVPSLSFGPKMVKDLKTKLKKNVHLMIENPELFVDSFIDAGADMVIVHLEACQDLDALIKHVKKRKVRIGLSIKAETKPYWLRYYLEAVDLILVMCIPAGFGGQKFMYSSLEKIEEIRQMNKKIDIAVDGGINKETGKLCALAGADILVSGTFVFASKDPKKAVDILKSL